MEHQISIRKQLGLSADGVAHYGMPVVSGHGQPRGFCALPQPAHVATHHALALDPRSSCSRWILLIPNTFIAERGGSGALRGNCLCLTPRTGAIGSSRET